MERWYQGSIGVCLCVPWYFWRHFWCFNILNNSLNLFDNDGKGCREWESFTIWLTRSVVGWESVETLRANDAEGKRTRQGFFHRWSECLQDRDNLKVRASHQKWSGGRNVPHKWLMRRCFQSAVWQRSAGSSFKTKSHKIRDDVVRGKHTNLTIVSAACNSCRVNLVVVHLFSPWSLEWNRWQYFKTPMRTSDAASDWIYCF